MSAKIGRYAFGFTWGAWFAMFLAMIFLFVGGLVGRKDTTATSTGRRSFFRRQRSRRSARGSLVDNESQRRVKEEYS